MPLRPEFNLRLRLHFPDTEKHGQATIRLEAIATSLEAIATRLEAIAIRLLSKLLGDFGVASPQILQVKTGSIRQPVALKLQDHLSTPTAAAASSYLH